MARDIEKPSRSINPKSEYILGLDVARQGFDQTSFVVLEKLFVGDSIFIVHVEAVNFTTLTATIGRCMYLNNIFRFKKIYIDSTGMGSGVCDVLKEKISRGVVEEIIFTRTSKAEMFYNLKLLMQQKRLVIPDFKKDNNPILRKLYFQFLSIQQEFKGDSMVPKISHQSNTHDDIICALALSCIFYSQRRIFKRDYYIAGHTTI